MATSPAFSSEKAGLFLFLPCFLNFFSDVRSVIQGWFARKIPQTLETGLKSPKTGLES